MASFLQKIREYWQPIVSEYPKSMKFPTPETEVAPLDKREKLLKAIEKKDLEKLELLIKEGVDVNTSDDNGLTPLHHAVKQGCSFSIIKTLIGADAFINSKNSWSETPFHYAIALGRCNTIRYLMAFGADISMQNNFNDTPMHYALLYECKGIADYLQAKGAKL